jgi:hypothetical protein
LVSFNNHGERERKAKLLTFYFMGYNWYVPIFPLKRVIISIGIVIMIVINALLVAFFCRRRKSKSKAFDYDIIENKLNEENVLFIQEALTANNKYRVKRNGKALLYFLSIFESNLVFLIFSSPKVISQRQTFASQSHIIKNG